MRKRARDAWEKETKGSLSYTFLFKRKGVIK